MATDRSKSQIKNVTGGIAAGIVDSRINMRELRAFVCVADTGSFRSAAKLLGYTQSAVSHQISSLETMLAVTLFNRPGGRGSISLTTAGHIAYRHARRALGAVEALITQTRTADAPGSNQIRVGAFRTAAAELLPAALSTFSRERPTVNVVISDTSETPDLVTSLAEGRLDMAFVLNPKPDDRVEIVPLIDDPWVILTSKENPITNVVHPSFDVLNDAQLVAWHLRWRTQAELEDLLAGRGINPRIIYRTDDNLALQRLVAVGLGHACVGRLAARASIDPRLTWLQPREQLVPRQIALCYPRQREISGTVMSLVDAIREASGGETSAGRRT